MCAGRGGLIGAKESGRGEEEGRSGGEGVRNGEDGEDPRAVGLTLEPFRRGGNVSGESPLASAQWIGLTGKPGGELGDFGVGF